MRRETLCVAGIAGGVLVGVAAIGFLSTGSRGTGGDGTSASSVEGVATAPAARCSCGGSCGETGSLLLAGTTLGNAAHAFDNDPLRKGGGADLYCCPMHLQVASRVPGMCPICRAVLAKVPARRGTRDACRCPDCPFRPRAGDASPASSTVSR